jgi:hypothetical protein
MLHGARRQGSQRNRPEYDKLIKTLGFGFFRGRTTFRQQGCCANKQKVPADPDKL